MTPKLRRLANAIVEFEGWKSGAPLENVQSTMSITWRNHNPGALRSSPFQAGKRDDFAYFMDDEIGYFALLYDLWIKCSGKSATGLTKESTLWEMIKVYSAEPENIVNQYVRFLESRTGLKADTKISNILK